MSDHSHTAESDARLDALREWVETLDGFDAPDIQPASDDASFRRYFRVHTEGGTWVAMDAPPDKEDCRPFVDVAGYLRDFGVNAPAIVAGDLEQGFLLMTDFGDRTYLAALEADPSRETRLYSDALDALLTMQKAGASVHARLPAYDEALLRREMDLFYDWLLSGFLEMSIDATFRETWASACDALVANALAQPAVFVHRDYHSRNLMVTLVDNPGVIDFQDAVRGPVTYDLVSLLRDCYYSVESARLDEWLASFFRRAAGWLPAGCDTATFRRWFDLMGVQRHLKAAGIFARLYLRDGKDRYLGDLPRTLGYLVEVGRAYAETAPLADFVATRCLPDVEARL